MRILQCHAGHLWVCGVAGGGPTVADLMQMVTQARWHTDAPFLTLPHITTDHLDAFSSFPSLPQLMEVVKGDKYEVVAAPLRTHLEEGQVQAAYRTLQHLPRMAVSACVRGPKGDVLQNGNVCAVGRKGVEGASVVEAGQDYTLAVTLTRLNRSQDLRVHTHKFPKPKDEGWFLVLGQVEAGELVALRRVPAVRNRSTKVLAFKTPQKLGQAVLTLYLMSDGYLGLDQQYDIPLKVIPATHHKDEDDEFEEEQEVVSEEPTKKWLPPPPDILPVMKSCFTEKKKEKEEEEEEGGRESPSSESTVPQRPPIPGLAWGGREQRPRGGRRRNHR
ncbi:Activating signal cointegrator 1 complex subunit 3 [Chionoecetes opilio]|uniref:Activating signal cointegrator 1 complex subunit 3 n=1 Tax=Chionoecetes opilio TaxID=41210 RepID=A0A8J4Y484_CHIOP|nr:Activating signal cointegrator 1 complex subunit 3 [Chionoecetes opilio]